MAAFTTPRFVANEHTGSGPVLARSGCQPLAVLNLIDGRYRPECLCGWQARRSYQNRAEALVMAGALHDRKAVA